MLAVLDVHRGLHNCRVVGEVRAQRLAIPGPRALGRHIPGHRGVDSRQPAALLDEGLKGRLLLLVQNVTRRAQKDHHLIPRQVRGRKHAGVLRRIHREMVLGAELLDRRNAIGDGCMPEHQRLREYQRPELGRRRLHSGPAQPQSKPAARQGARQQTSKSSSPKHDAPPPPLKDFRKPIARKPASG